VIASPEQLLGTKEFAVEMSFSIRHVKLQIMFVILFMGL